MHADHHLFAAHELDLWLDIGPKVVERLELIEKLNRDGSLLGADAERYRDLCRELGPPANPCDPDLVREGLRDCHHGGLG